MAQPAGPARGVAARGAASSVSRLLAGVTAALLLAGCSSPDADPPASGPGGSASAEPNLSPPTTPDPVLATPSPTGPTAPDGVPSTGPREPGAGITSGHTGTWSGDPVAGDFGLDDDVPPQPHQFLWYLELPDDAVRQSDAPAGYTIAVLPSGCEFRAFQGSVSGEAAPDVSDRVGTDQVGDLLRAQFARDGVSDFSDIDPLTLTLNHDDGTLEFAGMSASYSAQDAPWSSRTYYRGLPGSDSALFLTLSCAEGDIEAGEADLAALLADSTVVPGP